MTKEQKVSKYILKNRGGYIHPIGNGMYIIIKLPLEFCGIQVDSSRIHISSKDGYRVIDNIYFTIQNNWAIEKIIQAVLIGDCLYNVFKCICIESGWTKAGFTGCYHIAGSEVYPNKQGVKQNFN